MSRNTSEMAKSREVMTFFKSSFKYSSKSLNNGRISPLHPFLQLSVDKQKETVDQQCGYCGKNNFRYHDLLKIVKEIQSGPYQETEHIYIHVISQIIGNAQNQRQGNIILIIIFGENTVKIPCINKKQGIKSKWPAVKQIQIPAALPSINPFINTRIRSRFGAADKKAI